MSAYKIIAKNIGETAQYEIPFQTGTITWNLNNVHTASINVNFKYLKDYLEIQGVTLQQFFENTLMSFYIYKDNILFWAGILSNVRYSKNSGNQSITIDLKSWLAYFQNRFYSGTFSNVDQGDIGWSCINSVNDISITKGIVTATKNRDRTYFYDDVYKIVTGLSSFNINDGMDFDITNEKVYTALPRLGSDRNNIIFDEYEIINYNLQVGLLGTIINKAYIFGGGIGDSQVIRNYSVTTPYISNWHILEGKTQEINVEDTGVLDDKVTALVEQKKLPYRVLKIRVTDKFINDYSHGDGVIVNIPDISVSGIYRIKKKTVYFGDKDEVDLEFI